MQPALGLVTTGYKRDFSSSTKVQPTLGWVMAGCKRDSSSSIEMQLALGWLMAGYNRGPLPGTMITPAGPPSLPPHPQMTHSLK